MQQESDLSVDSISARKSRLLGCVTIRRRLEGKKESREGGLCIGFLRKMFWFGAMKVAVWQEKAPYDTNERRPSMRSKGSK